MDGTLGSGAGTQSPPQGGAGGRGASAAAAERTQALRTLRGWALRAGRHALDQLAQLSVARWREGDTANEQAGSSGVAALREATLAALQAGAVAAGGGAWNAQLAACMADVVVQQLSERKVRALRGKTVSRALIRHERRPLARCLACRPRNGSCPWARSCCL